MPGTLTIHDETPSGQKTNTFTLDFLNERVTLREIIRARIYQEVRDFNQSQPDYFKGLVQPSETEQTLNGYKLRRKRQINWEDQFEKALDAFQRNGFFMLVGDQQAGDLEEEFLITPETAVSFIKLVPLVGG